jgi:hypothetical protein
MQAVTTIDLTAQSKAEIWDQQPGRFRAGSLQWSALIRRRTGGWPATAFRCHCRRTGVVRSAVAGGRPARKRAARRRAAGSFWDELRALMPNCNTLPFLK